MDPINPSITSGYLAPYWLSSAKQVLTEKLGKDMETETVIIGGGITGITIAYMLSKAGKRCLLVEDGALGSGETGRTTAHLTNNLDMGYHEIKNFYDEPTCKACCTEPYGGNRHS